MKFDLSRMKQIRYAYVSAVASLRIFGFVFAGVLILFFAIVSLRSEEETSRPLKKIKLQLKWRHQFQFAGYYAAIEKGFYRDQGLEVEILESTFNEEPITQVLNGNAEYGVGTTDLLLMREQKKPVVALAAIFQHSPLSLLVRKDSEIRTLHELVGKTVMIEPHSAELFAYFEREGINTSKIFVQPHSFHINDLKDGKVSAISVYLSDEPFALEKNRIPYSIFSPRSAGIDFYSDILFTTEKRIEEFPDEVKTFRSASMKGWEYAKKNPEEIVQLIYHKYSKRHSIEHLRFEAEKMKILQPDIVEIGHMNLYRWKHIAEIYEEQGMLKPGLNLESFVYDPNPKLDLGWLYGTLFGILSFAILVVLISSYIFYLNRNLKISEAKSREANQTKDKFLAIISHDLRGPIGTIHLLFRDLIKTPSDLSEETLQEVRSSLHKTYRLLQDLLFWAENQKGEMKIQRENFSVRKSIEETKGLLFNQASQKEIQLILKPGIDSLAFADPSMIQLVLRNVIGNAIKFTNSGGSITIQVEESVDFTLVSVIDTGVGISEFHRDKLFSLEERISSKGTKNESGSGLGLIICKEFIEKNDGKIGVESESGKGSRVWFSIPKGKPSSNDKI
ncbi:hypothetical protein A0128_05440 [Leptospira tipperaryensis]|uniref:histidine kinase n=1 Tax=Leptospira tipperaryensis TaxID=2564040 RepID=A0A1D7UUQ2_9LEPT|nr:ABC transporter substrate-binding protein [Leptospira tipperaryensis]AOP33337.1 hypothetical protein A0128_05440 [Leptospira tipperaryensis]